MIKKTFNKYMDSLAYGFAKWDVFSDFCTYGMAILSNNPEELPRLKEKYKSLNTFRLMLNCVEAALQEKHQDFLGEVFMSNDLGSHWHGQFFTPYNISRMIAMMVGVDENAIKEKGYVTLCEPAAGSGGMVIAYAEALKQKGYDPSVMRVLTWDISNICWKMCYIQLSLLRIPARVVNGDTLKMEKYGEVLTTPLLLQLACPATSEVVSS